MVDRVTLGAEVITYGIRTRVMTLNSCWWVEGTTATGPVGKLVKIERKFFLRKRKGEKVTDKFSFLPTPDNLIIFEEMLSIWGDFAATRRLRALFPDAYPYRTTNPIRLPSQPDRKRP